MNRRILAGLTIFLILSFPFAEKVPVAVVDLLEKSGVSKDLAGTISDYLRTQLVNTDELIVVSRENMNSILAEQNFQAAACNTEECIVAAGKLLGVKKIFTGSLGRVGSIFLINIKMISIETGQIEKSASEEAASEEALLDAVKKAVAGFLGKIYTQPIVKDHPVITLPPVKASPVYTDPGYGFIDLLYGFGFAGMQLQFIRSDPPLTPGELGLSGTLPPSFTQINWPMVAVGMNTPLAFRVGGFMPKKPGRLQGGFYLDISYVHCYLKTQEVENWQIDYESTGGTFTFIDNEYFTSDIFSMSGVVLLKFVDSKFLDFYAGGGLGFTMNAWKAPFIYGYTSGDVFSPPSEGFNFGFNLAIPVIGFRAKVQSLQFVFEYSLQLAGFKPDRNVEGENNLAGYFLNTFRIGLGFSIH